MKKEEKKGVWTPNIDMLVCALKALASLDAPNGAWSEMFFSPVTHRWEEGPEGAWESSNQWHGHWHATKDAMLAFLGAAKEDRLPAAWISSVPRRSK